MPVRPKCSAVCRSPNPLIASGLVTISGHVVSISVRVNISLFSLRVSSDNFDSCLNILLQGSGKFCM